MQLYLSESTVLTACAISLLKVNSISFEYSKQLQPKKEFLIQL